MADGADQVTVAEVVPFAAFVLTLAGQRTVGGCVSTIHNDLITVISFLLQRERGDKLYDIMYSVNVE